MTDQTALSATSLSANTGAANSNNLPLTRIVICGFDKALASAITGVMDIFSLTGIAWNRIQQQHSQRHFEVKLASEGGKPVHCINGLTLQAHLAFDDIEQADVVVVPTIAGELDDTLNHNPGLLTLLQRADQNAWLIAGNCTGNFLLAQAGVLNHRQATTHWGFKDEFQQRFPQVALQTEQLITRHEHIYCAGGGLAWFDLCLHLIERFAGFEVAIQTAKAFVIDYRRDTQLSYSLMRLAKPHKDELVSEVQQWLEQHFAESISVDQLALRFSASKRTLIRRFNQALDMPPNTYLQTLRIEAAQKRLEETEQTIDQVMNAVGYEDASSFRRLFRKKTGLTPTEYRRRFSRRL